MKISGEDIRDGARVPVVVGAGADRLHHPAGAHPGPAQSLHHPPHPLPPEHLQRPHPGGVLCHQLLRERGRGRLQPRLSVTAPVFLIESLLQSLKNTFGWRRLEVVGSLSSLVFLFSLCFASAVEAVQTLVHSDHLDTFHHRGWIVGILAANLLVWLVSVVAIGGFSQHQTRSVDQQQIQTADWSKLKLSDLWRDLSVGLLTLLTCCLVQLQVVADQYCQYVDPIIALLSILCLVRTSIPILKNSCLILLQTIPGLLTTTLLENRKIIFRQRRYFIVKEISPGEIPRHPGHTRVPHLDLHPGNSGLHWPYPLPGSASLSRYQQPSRGISDQSRLLHRDNSARVPFLSSV